MKLGYRRIAVGLLAAASLAPPAGSQLFKHTTSIKLYGNNCAVPGREGEIRQAFISETEPKKYSVSVFIEMIDKENRVTMTDSQSIEDLSAKAAVQVAAKFCKEGEFPSGPRL